MTPQELEKRAERAAAEPFVISKVEGGFRVYTPTGSAKPYVVSGTADEPTCTCPDFEYHRADPEWRCKHILAVFRPAGAAQAPGAETPEPPPSTPAPHESRPPRAADSSDGSSRDASMVIKRSVSPDGRIDSLSVEFAAPVNGLQATEVEARAMRVLKLQDGIVGQFLKRNGKARTLPSAPEVPADGCAPAQLLGVGGADGKWGRRLFLIIQMNGRRLRLYGTKKQLTEHLTSAGYPKVATEVEEGLALNLPCRVGTKPSADGKFVNVERVLPAGQPSGQRG